MFMKKLFIAAWLVCGFAAAVALPAAAQESSALQPGAGVTVRPFEGPLPEEKFQHQILYRALEALGYTIAEPQQGDYKAMHEAVASGEFDFAAAHWQPLHKEFFDAAGGSAALVAVGRLLENTRQGYVVDKASYDLGIRNLGDLINPKVAERFDMDGDGKADLVGCNNNKNWGCQRIIDHHLYEYGLGDTVSHARGNYDELLWQIIKRYKAGKPVLYYAWEPYWVHGELVLDFDVKHLEVPYSSLPDGQADKTIFNGKNFGFPVSTQRVIVNVGFLNNNPVAAKLLETATLITDDISAQNDKMYKGENRDADIARHVDSWIFENNIKFEGWLKTARAAAR